MHDYGSSGLQREETTKMANTESNNQNAENENNSRKNRF
jgi:hypothetical protein